MHDRIGSLSLFSSCLSISLPLLLAPPDNRAHRSLFSLTVTRRPEMAELPNSVVSLQRSLVVSTNVPLFALSIPARIVLPLAHHP